MRSHLFSIALLAGTVAVVSPSVLSQSRLKEANRTRTQGEPRKSGAAGNRP